MAERKTADCISWLTVWSVRLGRWVTLLTPSGTRAAE